MEEIYVTVLSSSGLDFNPENTSSNFVNQLSRPINQESIAHNYEVGLVSVSFTPPASSLSSTATKDTTTAKTESTKKSFFPNGSDSVTVYTILDSKFEFKKSEGQPVFAFLADVERVMKSPTDSLAFSAIPQADGSEKTVVKWKSTNSTNLILPKELAYALGFDENVFFPGEFESPKSRDTVYYDSLPTDEKFTVLLKLRSANDIKISEPPSYSFMKLVSSINDSFDKNDYSVGFIYSRKKGLLTVNIGAGNLEFEFSPLIKKLLQLPEDFLFDQSKTHILVPNDLMRTDDDPPVRPVSPIAWLASDTVYVQSDIIESQLIGTSALPVLRSIEPSSSRSSLAHYEFSTVHYLPLSKQHISSVRIKLTDNKGVSLPATSFPTAAVLHFRRKWV